MSFDSGFNLGVQQSQQRTANARADKIQAEEAAERQVKLTLLRRNLEQTERENLVNEEARQRDAKDLVRADTAFGKFQAMTDAMDWSRPDALQQYQSLQKQFVPEITRHKSVLGKFNAYNQAVMGSQDFTDKMTMATTMADMRRQLINAGYGAEAMAAGKAVERGEKTMEEAITEFSDLLRSNKEQETRDKFDRDVQLRRAPTEAKVEGEMIGDYGGTSQGERGEKMDELTKMEAKSLLDRIGEADKALRVLPTNDTVKREAALRELQAAKIEYRKLKQSMKAAEPHYTGNAEANRQPAETPARQMEAGGTSDRVATREQFDALPSGATYIGRDGRTYKKP